MFERSADRRTIKCLEIVDNAAPDSVDIVAECAIGGSAFTRILDKLHTIRRLAQVIRTDCGKKFFCHEMLSSALGHGVELRLIEPGKPNHNAYVESYK